jgi:hypothetical protein
MLPLGRAIQLVIELYIYSFSSIAPAVFYYLKNANVLLRLPTIECRTKSQFTGIQSENLILACACTRTDSSSMSSPLAQLSADTGRVD